MTIRSAIASVAVSATLVATPLSAADLSAATTSRSDMAVSHYDAASETAARHRDYRYRGYRYRNRVDAGDIIAGVAIIGAVAAIANAAKRNGERYPDRRYPTSYPNYDRSSGLDRAVDRCVREIERDVRIGNVDSVDRTGSGWRVTGSLYNGDGFTCSIGNDGRIDNIDYGGRGGLSGTSYGDGSGYVEAEDNQWDDAAYTEARATSGYLQPDAPSAPSAQPAYPGGPLPGDYEYAEGDGYAG